MSDITTVEGTGETVGEAKWSALRELERRFPGLDRQAVAFQVLSEGERGLMGIGREPARVVATLGAVPTPERREAVENRPATARPGRRGRAPRPPRGPALGEESTSPEDAARCARSSARSPRASASERALHVGETDEAVTRRCRAASSAS